MTLARNQVRMIVLTQHAILLCHLAEENNASHKKKRHFFINKKTQDI